MFYVGFIVKCFAQNVTLFCYWLVHSMDLGSMFHRNQHGRLLTEDNFQFWYLLWEPSMLCPSLFASQHKTNILTNECKHDCGMHIGKTHALCQTLLFMWDLSKSRRCELFVALPMGITTSRLGFTLHLHSTEEEKKSINKYSSVKRFSL